jgi:hypothetical protein
MSAQHLLWIGHAVLVAVFVLAGMAKLRDLNRTSEGLTNFGISERWGRMATLALIGAELLVALLLVLPQTHVAGALGALGLLAMFTAAIVWQLLRGRRPSCACFGALSQAAISWKSVARNGLLMVLAVALLPGIGAFGALRSLTTEALAFVWAAIATLWLFQLTRQNGRLLIRIEELDAQRKTQHVAPIQKPLLIGDSVPPLGLFDARNRAFDLQMLRGKPTLLLFLDAYCSHCRPLLTRVRDYARANAATELVVISEHASLREEMPPEVVVLVDPGWTTQTLFGVRGTPAAVSVDAEGALARTAVHGTTAVRAALDNAMSQEVHHATAYELASV